MAVRKVVLITDFEGWGGTRSYFLLLSEYLIRKHVSLRIILASPQSLTPPEYERLRAEGVGIGYLPGFLLSKKKIVARLRINKLLQFFYLLFSVNGPFDKVIVSTGHSLFFLSGAWIWGKRFFYIQHTYPQGSPSRLTRYISPVRTVVYQMMARTHFTFITVSHASKRALIGLLAPGQRDFPVNVVYTPSIINLPDTVNRDGNLILTIGQMERWKNPYLWLQVALEVTGRDENASFVWAGSGTLLEEIRAQVPAGLQSRIRLPGYVEDVSGLLASALIYFQPSLVESQGISVADAMAFSLPCVVTDRGGLPESVENGITGYVISPDVAEATEKLVYLMKNKEMATKMGQEGYRKFKRDFSISGWQLQMDRLLFNAL